MSASRRISRWTIAVLVGTSVGTSTGRADTARADERIVIVGACGYPSVTVRADHREDIDDLCAALTDVRRFFSTLGFEFEPEFSIAFLGRAPAAPTPPAHGSFDPATREAVLYEQADTNPWGISWTRAISTTFLCHEFVHMAVTRILGKDSPRLRREWHEFIAAAIQFELMPADLRASVLDRYPGMTPAEDLREINAMTHELADPGDFGVLAYKTYQAHGRTELIRRLITFEIAPASIMDALPHGPER